MATETGFTKGACRDHEAKLEEYLSGDLGGAEAKAAAEHLKNCSGCRNAFEQAAGGARLLQVARATPEVSPDFALRVMARIRRVEQDRVSERARFWQPCVYLGWRFAATAVLALIALVAYGTRWTSRSQPNTIAMRPIEAHDFLFASDPTRPPANRDEALMMVAETDHGNN